MNYRIFIFLEDQERGKDIQKNSGENPQLSKAANSRRRKDHIRKITLVYSSTLDFIPWTNDRWRAVLSSFLLLLLPSCLTSFILSKQELVSHAVNLSIYLFIYLLIYVNHVFMKWDWRSHRKATARDAPVGTECQGQRWQALGGCRWLAGGTLDVMEWCRAAVSLCKSLNSHVPLRRREI